MIDGGFCRTECRLDGCDPACDPAPLGDALVARGAGLWAEVMQATGLDPMRLAPGGTLLAPSDDAVEFFAAAYNEAYADAPTNTTSGDHRQSRPRSLLQVAARRSPREISRTPTPPRPSESPFLPLLVPPPSPLLVGGTGGCPVESRGELQQCPPG